MAVLLVGVAESAAREGVDSMPSSADSCCALPGDSEAVTAVTPPPH